MTLPLFLTTAHLAWMVYWGRTYTRIRKARRYAHGRSQSDTNPRYKVIGYASFFTHNFVTLAAFWVSWPWLLKIHELAWLQLVGVAVLLAGTLLHAWAIRHLGDNYSPCFDSHLPRELVSSGPYQFIRHPDYLAKLIVSLGGFLMTGSLWLLGLHLWLFAEVLRSIRIEERELPRAFPAYKTYQAKTARLVPFIY